MTSTLVVIRGAGDLASGVALRLLRAGFQPVMTEIREPLAVRRTVSFSEAVYQGVVQVEGVTGRLASGWDSALEAVRQGEIPVLIDPELSLVHHQQPPSTAALVDARLLKTTAPVVPGILVIGLGPGFTPGENCMAVVETKRGHTLGRVYWDRPAAANTGLPDGNPARVLRAPQDGVILPQAAIADIVHAGDVVALVKNRENVSSVRAQVGGVVRGMLPAGLRVRQGLKIGDIDERADPSFCYLASDKALAVGGGVLEALLSIR